MAVLESSVASEMVGTPPLRLTACGQRRPDTQVSCPTSWQSTAEAEILFGNAAFRAEATDDLAAKADAKMLHGVLQIEFDGTDIDPDTGCDFMMRQLFKVGGDEYVAAPGRHFCENLFQRSQLQTRVDDRGGIRAFVRNVCDGGNFRGAEKMSIGTPPVFRDIDGGAEEIISRALDGNRLGHTFYAQKRLMERFPSQIGRPKASRQAGCKPFIVVRQGGAQHFAI